MLHHDLDRLVELIVRRVEEGEGAPLLVLAAGGTNLANVDAGNEEFEVLHELLRAVVGVELSQGREHALVSTLQAEARLEQSNELVRLATNLIVLHNLIELLSIHNNIQTADLEWCERLGMKEEREEVGPERGGSPRRQHRPC